jgi:outer membrane immunogenic protein
MKSSRLILLATVSTMALATNASAQNWSGFYVGMNVGGAVNRAAFADLGDSSVPPVQNRFVAGDFWTTRAAGFAVGGQIGFNWQVASLVYGLEADFNWANAKTSTFFPLQSVNASTSLDRFATVRGRLGFVVAPMVMIYATGGLAVGHFEDSWGSTFAVPTPEYSSSRTRTTLVVGGGFEYMFSPNWTVRVEGMVADFGNWTVNGPPGIIGPYRTRFDHSVATFRGGLNFKW